MAVSFSRSASSGICSMLSYRIPSTSKETGSSFPQLIEYFFLGIRLLRERDFIMRASKQRREYGVTVLWQNGQVSLPSWNEFKNNVFYCQIRSRGNFNMTTLAPTIYTRTFPRAAGWLRDLILMTLGTLFVAALAQVKILLPFTPIPLTGQTFAVLLIGATLGSKRSLVSMLLYIALGAFGLPIFAGGASGLAYLSGATFGYLIGFVMAAYIIGLLAERGLERNVRTSLIPFVVGTVIIYVCGIAWLALILGSYNKAITAGLLPFLLGDTFKLLAASLILPAAWKLVR